MKVQDQPQARNLSPSSKSFLVRRGTYLRSHSARMVINAELFVPQLGNTFSKAKAHRQC